MEKQYLGIDLGTSAVKLLLVAADGSIKRAKCAYTHPDVAGWLEALKNAVAALRKEDALQNLGGIALSAQVGTYLTDTGAVLGWESPAGRRELAQIKAAVEKEEWLEQIGMVHPDLCSYPIPRLLYLQKTFPETREVYMPKEMLLQELTGNRVTDVFSWRGLCNSKSKAYSERLLARFGIRSVLPALAAPTDLAGCVTARAAEAYGLPAGTPVYVGCNDFFAGLLGMGIWETGSVFELSGTSEHLGVITEAPVADAFVSGPYFNGCATYGGTKSSGASCSFAINRFGIDGVSPEQAFGKTPVFLPYLNGERAPVYDENARGVFFGINAATDARDLAYAVLEGVVFSLYHIGQALPISGQTRLITGGGSAGNEMMAKLKAALFGCPVEWVAENDSSALGAAILAMTGSGEFPSARDGARALVSFRTLAEPDARLGERLKARYAIYREVYEQLKTPFVQFSNL